MVIIIFHNTKEKSYIFGKKVYFEAHVRIKLYSLHLINLARRLSLFIYQSSKTF